MKLNEEIQIKNHKAFTVDPLKDKDANGTLVAGSKLLNTLSLKWWLSAGTLLGLHRDADFIPHDTDIDVGVEGDHYCDRLKIETLITLFELEGFELIRTIYKGNYPMQIAFRDSENVIFDIYFYYPVFKEMVNYNDHGTLTKPSIFFDTLNTIEFKGYTYPTPSNIEQYLIHRYGESWGIPKTSKESWEKDAANLVQ